MPQSVELLPLSVPYVDELPRLPESVVEFTDFVLRHVIARAPAQLDAEYMRESDCVPWTVQPTLLGNVGHETVAVCPRRWFRAVLARIGHHYMAGQVYYGFAWRSLICGESNVKAFFFLGNSSDTGYWVRITSRCR
jgi:hypothetical protein